MESLAPPGLGLAPERDSKRPIETRESKGSSLSDKKSPESQGAEWASGIDKNHHEIFWDRGMKIRREFYWNGGARKKYAREERKRIFNAEMGNLHIRRDAECGKFGRCLMSYRDICMEISKLFFGLFLWFGRLFLYIFKALFEPIYSRLPCFNVPDGARITWTECIMAWLTLAAICAYGFIYVLKFACNYDPNCITFRTETGAFMIAKAFGKAVTACFIVAMVFVLKPVTEYIETLPFEKRWGVGWRTVHKAFMNLAIIFAFCHFVAHVFRRRKATLPENYELWQSITGYVLFGLWFIAGSPFWLRGLLGTLDPSKLCGPLVSFFGGCFSSVTYTKIRVTWKGNVEWYSLRNDRPWDDLCRQLKLDSKTFKEGWVYGSKDHTLRLVHNNEQLNEALHTVREPVIRLDASGLDILDHDDIERASAMPSPNQRERKGMPIERKSSEKDESAVEGKELKESRSNPQELKEMKGNPQMDGTEEMIGRYSESETLNTVEVKALNGDKDYLSMHLKHDVLVSFENEAHVFHLRKKKPWDDLVVGLKETFVMDAEETCLTKSHKGPHFDKVEALLFSGSPDENGEYQCTRVNSNSTLAAALKVAGKKPRLLISQPKPRRRAQPAHAPLECCPLYGGQKSERNEKGYFSRWMFRWTHIPMFYAVAIIYTLHAQDIFPLIAIIIWTYCYRSRALPVEKILYSFSHSENKCSRYANINQKYLMNVRIKLAHSVVPDKYGYYAVLGRDTRLCSYTMVPMKGGSEFRMTIKHCTFIDSVLDQIAANENSVDVEELAKTGQTWYNLGRKFFRVYGPFMSSDHTIANAERIAVMVQTTGSVVSDAVISFQKIRKYWEKVLVFAVGSDLMDYDGHSMEDLTVSSRTDTTVFTNTDVQNWNPRQAKYQWITNRIDREIQDHMHRDLPSPINPGDKPDEFMEKLARLSTGIRARQNKLPVPPRKQSTKMVSSPKGKLTVEERRLLYKHPATAGNVPMWPHSVSFRGRLPKETKRDERDIAIIGLHRIHKPLADHILKQLQNHHYDVLVCSGAWAQHIHDILEEDKYDPSEKEPLEKLKLHLELFGD